MARGSNRGLGVDFTFDNHIGLINNRGDTVIHEIGLRCVCNQEDVFSGMITHGAHTQRKRRVMGCELCSGFGYIYRKPVTLVGIVTGIRETKSQMEGGWAVPGDSIISVKMGTEISGGDQITFTWPQPITDGQVLIRGAGHMNDNSSRITLLEEIEDRLWYNAESAIYCEDEDGIEYHSGSDFTLNGSKIIKWVGNKPADGKAYTIKYNAYLEWLAFFPPEVRRDRDRDFGTRVSLRKKHVHLLDSNPTTSVTDRVTFCERLKYTCST